MDIGIMPLLESGWSQGKCGFKAIQYLALGIPAVATPVGVSSEILGHGAHGKLCSTEKEWASAILELANSASLRENLGLLGRKFIADHYSSERWKSAFRKIVLDA